MQQQIFFINYISTNLGKTNIYDFKIKFLCDCFGVNEALQNQDQSGLNKIKLTSLTRLRTRSFHN